ncbi:MAG: hypothetical protein PHP79_10020, partial [Clostridia bacterium]|nr:hypothetical protein [Clostridia bacterium]
VWGGDYQDLNITYRQLSIEDIHPNILDDFNRYQEVKKCWRKQNGEWFLVDNHFIDDWVLNGKLESGQTASCFQAIS